MQQLRSRPAAPADRAFVERVYFETQRWIIERLFGWRGDAFERCKFEEFYDERHTQIIEVDDEPAGWMTVLYEPERIEIDSIYLAKEYQNMGIGSKLLWGIIAQAEAAGKPVTLSTAKINPAKKLYERLGFVTVGENEFKAFMERK